MSYFRENEQEILPSMTQASSSGIISTNCSPIVQPSTYHKNDVFGYRLIYNIINTFFIEY